MEYHFNKELPVAIGADHAGFEYKEMIRTYLTSLGWQVEDKGTYSHESTDYPDFAHPVAQMVADGKAACGILVCGSGNGVCITANKHAGVRAALSWNDDVAELARQHNNANVLCIPSRFMSEDMAKKTVLKFMTSEFEGGRHQRRVEKIPMQA